MPSRASPGPARWWIQGGPRSEKGRGSDGGGVGGGISKTQGILCACAGTRTHVYAHVHIHIHTWYHRADKGWAHSYNTFQVGGVDVLTDLTDVHHCYFLLMHIGRIHMNRNGSSALLRILYCFALSSSPSTISFFAGVFSAPISL